jgi:thiol-disulfide isomerase/thioredoxin
MNRRINHVTKLISQLLLLSLLTCLAAAAVADDSKLPFGIRHYDKGLAPDFSLQDMDGDTFELKSARGHWVFLHFWASWCGPCKKEMPTVQRLADIMQNQLQVVMINTAEDEDTIFAFLAAINVELNCLLDRDGLVTEVWKPRGLPTTFLIDPQGMIKYQAIGGRDWDKPEYITFLKQLLKTAE